MYERERERGSMCAHKLGRGREGEREREREGERERERERERDAESEAAPGSELSAQSPTRGSNSQTARSRPEIGRASCRERVSSPV